MIPEGSGNSKQSVEKEAALDQGVLPPVVADDTARQDRNALRKKALDLLARREHSVSELHQKLTSHAKKKEIDTGLATGTIDELQQEGLVSDERFTEAFIHYRQNNGYGPVRIQSELRERGVSEKIQGAYLDFADPQWLDQAALVRRKRFGDGLPEDYKERARQARFLQYRGFTTDQARQAMAGDEVY
ncbi:regulatory protein RecX [Kaarinaea lacus]